MKVNMFMPKYMVDFKCIGPECVDTCCAGWDINIDEDTYEKYISSEGSLKELVNEKFIENKVNNDFFNKGLMVLTDKNRCPFLNDNLLCDIHGEIGEDNLCITCKRYPRVYNIIDGVYEKSGLPSCIEVCTLAFLNREKMEFIEVEEELDDDTIEIRRIIDTEAFEGTDSLLQYFWDIRVNSINIIQNREFSIEERLNILKNFYNSIETFYKEDNFDSLEQFLEDFTEGNINLEYLKGEKFIETNEFYNSLLDRELINNIKGARLKICVSEYKKGISKFNNISEYINENEEKFIALEKYSYILENYLVNQIFKDLIPFNKGESFNLSINVLINSYRIIKAYVLGIALNSQGIIKKEEIIRVIQSLSKDIEHNKVFKDILELNI